jgi:hypothetical protein
MVVANLEPGGDDPRLGRARAAVERALRAAESCES